MTADDWYDEFDLDDWWDEVDSQAKRHFGD